MSQNMSDTDDKLSYEDVGVLLKAKAEKLESGADDPETIIDEIMETVGRSEVVTHRQRTVGTQGRVSVGRNLSGKRGRVLFLLDADERDEDDE